MNTFEQVTNLVKAQVDFVDKEFETLTESVITASGLCQLQSLTVDQVKGDEDVTETLDGLAEVAQTIGKSFGTLSADEKTGLKASMAKIIRFPNNAQLEAALEGLFGGYIDLLDAVKSLNDYVATKTTGN
jgi:hypothetical protein